MREIKFRVWSVLATRMINWENIFHLPAWEIFPGTPEQRPFNVMQYTGLKDKNGMEIYEGDILRLDRDELLKNLEPEDVPDDTLIQVVAFENGAFTARSRSGRKWGGVSGMYRYGEIIGNVYETPELLQ